MVIEMTGGIYCALSAGDPQHRLHELVQQTQSRLVLVHWLTKPIFDDAFITVKIDSILTNNNLDTDVNLRSIVECVSYTQQYSLYHIHKWLNWNTESGKFVSHLYNS